LRERCRSSPAAGADRRGLPRRDGGCPGIFSRVTDLTRLLDAAPGGDRRAASELLPLVYDELRTLAAARLAAGPSGRALQPTALFLQAYLRLVGPADPGDSPEAPSAGRAHFFGASVSPEQVPEGACGLPGPGYADGRTNPLPAGYSFGPAGH
jgi:ECF sigma factor